MPYQKTAQLTVDCQATIGHPQCTPTLKAQEILYHGRGGRNSVRVRKYVSAMKLYLLKLLGKLHP